MPVYEFRCPKCLEIEEDVIPMTNRNDTRFHSCGAVMERLISRSGLVIIKEYAKDKICNTLNVEHKQPFVDGRPVRSKRATEALASGLTYERPIEDKVFTGF